LREVSHVNLQGLQAIQHHELQRMIGRLSEKEMREVRQGLEWTLDLDGSQS